MKAPPKWVDQYMSIPFVHAGRTREGADCWGMVRLVLVEQAKIEVEEFAGLSGLTAISSALRIRRQLRSKVWQQTAGGAVFTCVPMLATEQAGKDQVLLEMHIGIIVSEGYLLHTEQASGPSCVRLTDPDIVGRLRYPFRRHASL